MKMLILCGHGYDGSNYDPGAMGCGFTEATETIRYGNKVAENLRKYMEVDVFEGNMFHRLFYGAGSYDFTGYDYVIEFHLNAAANSSAHGTEIYVTTMENAITVEQNLMKRLSKYFTLRDNDAVFDGVKRFNYGVINAIKSQDKVSAALLELCFITCKSDMDTYNQKFDAICNDIAEGIAEGFELKSSGNVVEVPVDAPVAPPKPKPTPAPIDKRTDQICEPNSHVVLEGVHRVDQVLASMDSIWCAELTGDGGNSIQAAPLIKCDRNGKATASQVFSVGDYFKCDEKFTVLAVDAETDAIQINVGSRVIWVYAKPFKEVI